MDWGNLLLGGQGSTPGQFATPYADNSQIQGYVQQGMGNINGTGPQLDPTQQQQFRDMQMQQAAQLQRIASGQQQGAGELAAQRQTQNAIASQQAMARMARGGNSSLAYRGAADNTGALGLSGAGMAQQSALQDQTNAQNALTGALGQGRGQDIGLAGQNANLQQQQYGLNTQRGLGYAGLLGQMDQGQLAAQAAMYGAAQGNKGALGGILQGAAQGGMQAAMSDERVKTGIADAGAEIDDMLDKLVAKSYRYKNEARHGTGRRPGIMAQDAERSRLGASFVREVPDGKALDVNRALSAALASAARLNARLRKLEGKAA